MRLTLTTIFRGEQRSSYYLLLKAVEFCRGAGEERVFSTAEQSA
jgi:hypothetical protein